MQDVHELRAKLCRELAQSEHDAQLHPRREARRLGDIPPAHALLAIADHADEVRPRFDALLAKRAPKGRRLGRAVGKLFSGIRHAVVDRLISNERSYRATLLGLRHGIDCTRLLREVAICEADYHLVRFCDELLLERLALIERAEQALAYFAECASVRALHNAESPRVSQTTPVRE